MPKREGGCGELVGGADPHDERRSAKYVKALAKAERSYEVAIAARDTAGREDRHDAEALVASTMRRISRLKRRRRQELCRAAWSNGSLEPVEDDDGGLLYPTEADVPTRVGWLVRNMRQFIKTARLCERLPNGDFKARAFIAPLRRIFSDICSSVVFLQSLAPVDWEPQTAEQKAAGFKIGRPRVGRGVRVFPDTLQAICLEITFSWLANVQETGIVPLATVEKLERLLEPLDRNLARWNVRVTTDARGKQRESSLRTSGAPPRGAGENSDELTLTPQNAPGTSAGRESATLARGLKPETAVDPGSRIAAELARVGERLGLPGASTSSPWHASHTGGMPARGWAEITDVLAVTKTEAMQRKLTRLNENTGGPITWCGGIPEADRGELRAWAEDSRGRRDVLEARRRNEMRTIQELGARDGAGLADHGLQKERRPNARGKAK